MRKTVNASEYVRRSLGENLFAARRTAGLSQRNLAKKVGKGQSTVCRAEKGQIRVTTAYVRAVLKACGVPKNWNKRTWQEAKR